MLSFTGGTLGVTGNLFYSWRYNLSNQATISVGGNITIPPVHNNEQVRISMIGAGVKTFGGVGNFGTIEFNNAAGLLHLPMLL